MGQTQFQRRDGLDHVKSLPRAGRAGNDCHPPVSQAKRFQDLKANLDLFHRVGRQADANGIANPEPQQRSQTDGGLHRPRNQPAGLGDPQMNGRVRNPRQLLICRRCHEHIRRLHRDLEFVKIVVLQQLDVIHSGFHHRIRARLAILVQQMFFQRSRIHPDPDRAAVILGRPHHLGHPRG